MKVVLGIGNPDEKYAGTRHNVGWMTVDLLSHKMDRKFKKAGFEYWAAEGRLGRHPAVLVKTWTYVNETGRVVPELRKRYGEELMVVCDDVNLPLDPSFRIGVGGGRPDPSYVLGRFTKEEKPVVEETVGWACDAVRSWMDDGIEKCMTRFNRRTDK